MCARAHKISQFNNVICDGKNFFENILINRNELAAKRGRGGEGELDGRKIFFRDSSSLFRNYDLKRKKEKNVTQNYARRWRERKKEKKKLQNEMPR